MPFAHTDTICKPRHQAKKLSQINSFASSKGTDEPSCKGSFMSWRAPSLRLYFFQYGTCVKWTGLLGLFFILYHLYHVYLPHPFTLPAGSRSLFFPHFPFPNPRCCVVAEWQRSFETDQMCQPPYADNVLQKIRKKGKKNGKMWGEKKLSLMCKM